MSVQLRLSFNELSALLKSVFQGCFGHSQDWAAITETVMWLETRGLGGLDMLIDALGEDLQLTSCDLEIKDIDPRTCEIDLNTTSLLLVLHMCADLAMDMATSSGRATLIIKNAQHTSAIVAAMPSCASFKYPVQAIWGTGVAHCNHNDVSPSIYGGQSESVELHIGRSNFDGGGPTKVSSADIQFRFYEALSIGIPVSTDIFATLNRVADRILVEATDASRRGAGE